MNYIALSTGQQVLRYGLHVEVRQPSPSDLCRPSEGRGIKGEGSATQDPSIHQSTNPAILDFVASDATLDRYSEIISPTGWNLDTYRRNPVFQNSHQYGDILFTLGKALITEVRDIG